MGVLRRRPGAGGTEAVLAYLRGVIETLQERFDIEVEWATMPGVDLLRRRERPE